MTTAQEIEAKIEAWKPSATGAAGASDPLVDANELLNLGDAILENWLVAHDREPGDDMREGFRLLGLHRQAAKGDPSFNACRETCREMAYRFNLIELDPHAEEAHKHLVTMRRLAHHLILFVSGKLQDAELGDFCCSSRSLRQTADQQH